MNLTGNFKKNKPLQGVIKMYKAYKFRLYPTNNQKNTINQTFGNLRFIYNYYANKITTQGYKSVYNN